ncbi:MAG: Holliday junction resolvase RecU [Acholeplasmatales bacterium]|nr:Holliday junction resolvase RecU [Acholeplasmatales bacterium]
MNFPAGVRKKQINNIIKTENTKKVWKANMANKGMSLEEMVNNSNIYYLDNNIAVIHKKPIPIQIVKVSYPSRQKAVITEAYYRTPSTTDYNGIYKGKYIDFDAKECSSTTSFTLKNVHEHQFKHLKAIKEQGGIGFFLVAWNKYEEYYILEIDQYMSFYNESLHGGRQSIPYSFFKENCIQIYTGYRPEIDYLKGVDKLILPHVFKV